MAVRLRVKEKAKELGISQGKLSRSSDVDIKTLQKIYRHPMSIVTTETLDKLAKALSCSVHDLIEDVPDEQRFKGDC
ncbi:MAG: helix-turn-helix transcriptional regulator [Chloroflexota bacterium]|nr:MAG: helix-turn-helix transcriptional regulator [Chloroflexota bacterium]TMD63151.1 MAG: helix-turn-helix transcriptional regulator [Chloroflexota bacterium]